jgi:hypothetical protein
MSRVKDRLVGQLGEQQTRLLVHTIPVNNEMKVQWCLLRVKERKMRVCARK